MAKRDPEEIAEAVERHYEATEPLRTRMDDDYSLYRLDDYSGEDELDGFRKYTSNEPRTFANKAISLLAGANLVLRVPQVKKQEDEREIRNDKERFLLGALRSADERLTRLMIPNLKSQLAFHTTMRGWYAAVAMIVKPEDEDRQPYFHVMPLDPRNVYWEMGADGLNWACYKISKMPSEIKSEYGVDVKDRDGSTPKGSVDVYVYFDKEDNTVCTDSQVLKKSTPHGSPRVPIVIGPVGAAPLIHDPKNDDTIKEFGESIYQAARNVYKEYNFELSAMSEFVSRSLKRPYAIESRDGTLTLPENPFLSGSEISLAAGERIVPLDVMEMARETGVFTSMISGEMQRASLPHSAFGELQFQLSGFAINSLRQGMTTVIEFPLRAMESAYKQICDLISDQYASESFPAMTLSGRDQQPRREYFSEEITPKMVAEGGDVEVTLSAMLPQDDMSKFAMAAQAQSGPVPLFADRYIREEILGVQDADLMADEVLEQMARRSSPVAAAYKMMLAAVDSGDEDLAQIWLGEVQKELIQAQLQMGQLRMAATGMQQQQMQQQMQQMQPQGPTNGARPTFDPRVAPNVALGQQPPMPVPQAGPMVPPGTPRPGAISEEERLRRMGLFGG